MSGNVVIIGWTNASPLYREYEPQIGYEPGLDRNTILKRVTRRIKCFTKNKTAVIQSLKMDDAVLTGVCLNEDGTAGTFALGGGWRLLTLSDDKAETGYSSISVTYEKNVARLFELGLPDGVSVTCENGVCRIAHGETTLEELDSGTGVCREGLEITVTPAGYLPPDNDTDWFTVDVRCNGVMFDQIGIPGSALDQRVTRFERRLAGPFSETPTPDRLATAQSTSGADRVIVRTVATQQRITVPINTPYVFSEDDSEEQVFSTIEFVTVTQFFIWGLFSLSRPDPNKYDPRGVVVFRVPQVEWRVDGDRLKIVCANTVIRDYEIPS